MAKTKFVRMPLYGKSGIVGHTKVDTADYVVLVTAGLTRWNLMRYGKYAYRRVPGYFHDEQEARAAAQELRQSLMSHAVD